MSENNKNCPCNWPGCVNHGKCNACRNNHHPYSEKTACEKLAEKQQVAR
ncbi:MAG: hypothetical protein PHV75_05780 [Victivallaceae bacterium]|nr:hypothetical protein [Victivallaceae bacterium]MDD3703061.1 hypothetical protein [Victivallaceae bacterium]MDD4318009.1 hypothetical protein [Victivallaceae bacterium]MDD5663316.1 hypothetical protein [Victivallaceae bacterium]